MGKGEHVYRVEAPGADGPDGPVRSSFERKKGLERGVERFFPFLEQLPGFQVTKGENQKLKGEERNYLVQKPPDLWSETTAGGKSLNKCLWGKETTSSMSEFGRVPFLTREGEPRPCRENWLKEKRKGGQNGTVNRFRKEAVVDKIEKGGKPLRRRGGSLQWCANKEKWEEKGKSLGGGGDGGGGGGNYHPPPRGNYKVERPTPGGFLILGDSFH